MDLKIGIRDKRQPGWYQIDNEVYDLGLSCEGLAIYNAIARYANNDTEKAYFSGKKWKRHHKVGHGKLVSGMRELISHRLIAPTGSKTPVGAAYFELCNIDHLKVKSKAKPCTTSEQGGVLPQNRGGSTPEQGGVPRQNTNNTNKTILKNKTEKTTPTNDNPLNRPRLLPNASQLCIEAMDAFNTQILKRTRQPDYTMWPAWVALSGDEQAVYETIMGIIQASKNPDARIPFALDGVFRDPARAAYWRSRYKATSSAKIEAEPDYEAQTMQELENMTDAERAARFAWYAQTGLIAPQEAVKKWKHLMPNLTQSQAS